MIVDCFLQLFSSATSQGVHAKGGKGRVPKSDSTTLVIVFMAFLCAVLPLDISQLSFAIIGAFLYAALQKSDQFAPKKQRISVVVEAGAPHNVAARNQKPRAQTNRPANSPPPAAAPPAAPEVRAFSVQPILPPTFQSKSWEGEIQELLLQIAPTTEGDKIVKQIANLIQQTIRTSVPEIEVDGFANGNFATGRAFGVAVPDVDIVARVNPQVLFARLHGRGSQGGTAQLDIKKLQKNAIRTFTDKLVSAAGFKFRRSAFRGQDPKVTLLAPATLGLFSDAIPINFSVNVITPLYNAALLSECGRMDCRAKQLILVVKRWAKDRGICHAAKGHFSPYLWGLLTIYFLQVRDSDAEGPVLPPLDQFEMSESLLGRQKAEALKKPKWQPAQTEEPKKSAAALFKEFVKFFQSFDWSNEAVSIRAGRRAAPHPELPLHIIVQNGSEASQVGPSIEDPFHVGQNLGDGMNAVSLARLKEELLRAKGLCDSDASLTELLDPWVPPDFETNDPQHDDEQADGKETSSGALSPQTVLRPTAEVLKSQPAPTPKAEPPKKVTGSGANGSNWRRDAAEAQASAAGRPSPPWRTTSQLCKPTA